MVSDVYQVSRTHFGSRKYTEGNLVPTDEDSILAAIPLIRPILDQITDKWSIMILTLICPEPQRFNAIKRRLGCVTQKSLTQTLRRLERNGLVTRRVIPASPIAVEYSLTPLGHSLREPFTALYVWTVDHVADIGEAQQQFDKSVKDVDIKARHSGSV